jgi:hypothetical protein
MQEIFLIRRKEKEERWNLIWIWWELRIKNLLVDQSKLSDELNGSVLNVDRAKIQILSTIDKSKVDGSIRKPKIERWIENPKAKIEGSIEDPNVYFRNEDKKEIVFIWWKEREEL